MNYAAKWNDAGSAVELTVTPEKAGKVYYLVQNSGEAAPSESSVKDGNSSACAAGQETTIEITASDKTAKDIYVIYQETGSDSSYEMSKMTLPAYKTISVSEGSAAGSVSISGERSGSESLSLTVKPTVDGTLYYIVTDADASAPSDSDFASADSISESANTSKTTKISLGTNPTEAKKLYLRYKSNDGTLVTETAVMDVPALDSSSFAAEISSSELNLGTFLEGYSASDHSADATISNTGSGTLSFSVDKTADGYSEFIKYFDVDISGAEDIASGKKGSITVTPKEGLEAGEYSGTFYLVDQIDENTTLKLGPVTVKMTVAAKGDSTVDGVRSPEGKYTPSVSWDGDLQEITIDDSVAYCANYYYILDSTSNTKMHTLYENQYGVIRSVTNKELDSYTGLNPNSDPVVYPPNTKGFTPVKEGSDSSTVRDNVARVLYYGYPNDALGLRSSGGTKWNDNNYQYVLIEKDRKDLAFEIATQCAIWHYTDGIDFSNINSSSETDPRVRHVWSIYKTLTDWGWEDVQNLYNFLVGTTDKELLGRGEFRNGVDYPSNLSDAPEDFSVNLFVVDNPIEYNYTDYWTQNLITGSASTETTDVSITKKWADDSNADGKRPDADEFKSWIRLYHGTTDVTEKYSDKLTVKDNGNNTYTVTYTGLPKSGSSYTIKEEIPDSYSDSYKIPDGKNSAKNDGSIKNYAPTKETQNAELTIKKTDSDGNTLEGAKFTLYSDEACTDAIAEIDASDGTATISTKSSYLKSYLPTENNGTATVYLKETTAPKGYELSDTVYPITLKTMIEEGWNSDNSEYDVTTSHTITYKDNVTLTVSDKAKTDTAEKYEKLTITKVSDDGQNKLEGAGFTLYSDENCENKVAVLDATGSDGTVVIDTENLPSGLTNPESGTKTYYLKETTVPDGYTASGKVYPVVLGTTVSSDWNSDHTAYVTTTTHTIRSYGSNALSVSNTSKSSTVNHSSLTIYKNDADTEDTLSGATFALYEDENGETKIDGSEITTNSNGQAVINTSAGYLSSYLPTEDGTKTIYLKETGAPTGYQSSDKVYPITITRSTKDDVITYTITNGSSSTLTVGNQPKTESKTVNSDLTLYKVNETQQPVSGAEFTLYSDSDCTNSIKTLSATDENGNITINTGADYLSDYLPTEDNGTNKVYLKETKAPSGYALNDTVYTLTLTKKVTNEWNSDHTAKAETTAYSITNEESDAITVVDQTVISLEVNKVWNTTPLDSKVTFELTRNGKKVEGKTVDLNAQNKWKAAFENLPKYDSDGSEIEYGVVEVDGNKYYDVSYDRNSDGSITVTNDSKKIHTTVSANGTKSSSDKAVETTDTSVEVVDTVSYETLDTETEYTIKGQLMDVTDTNNIVTVGDAVTKTFTPTEASGTVDVDLGTQTLTPGHTYVVYETLYLDNKVVAEHSDENDKAQTIVVNEETPTPTPETPSISTTVSANGESASSDSAVETSLTSVKVVDTVTYKNLTAGTEYTLEGQLMDVTDQDNITSVGDAQTVTFTPSESNGTQDIDLGTLDLKPGHTYVVYETLYEGGSAEGTAVAEHKDKDDKAQTVVVTETPIVSSDSPSISTTVSANGEASTEEIAVETTDTSVDVVDTVSYENLDTETKYTLEGQLMDVTDADNIVSVGDAVTKTFTPTGSDGSVNISFGTMDLEAGHTYVVYETLYEGDTAEGTSVAEHKDKDSTAQTIVVTSETPIVKSDYPSISTTISADGEKSTSKKAVTTDKTRVHVVDTVYYNDLTVGETYTLKGKLIDVTAGGSVVTTATKTFTAKTEDGSVKIDFDRVSLKAGHKYVAFEYLYEGKTAEGSPVAVHKDKKDKAQTLIVAGAANTSTSTNSGTNQGVKTGDNASLIWGVLLAGALVALLITMKKRRSSER
ncbi:MAG: VaFE repeat-containing surface-anchored protein [Anaerovoracaceae bacterium]